MSALSQRQKQILDFGNSPETKELEVYYAKPSIFSALGVSRHENTHSNFIAWLLTPKPVKNDHGLGDMPLRKLLETLAFICSSMPHAKGKLPLETANAIIAGAYTLSDIRVEREKYIGNGRLDIYLEGTIVIGDVPQPLRIVIENKVKSSEHDSQTGRYQEALKQSVSCPGIYLSVYLTPLNNREYERLESPECECKDFIQLNYQHLANLVITPSRDLASDERIKRYLDEYLHALGLPEIRQDKGDIIMAISKEEQDLLSRFWDKHKDLLMAALLSIGNYLPLEETEHKIVSEASQTLQNAVQRDLTRYTWKSLGKAGKNLPKSRLVLEIVTHYVNNHRSIALAELKMVFPDELQGGTFGVVAPLDAANAKDPARYYIKEVLNLSDGPVVVCNQWRVDNIQVFIESAQKHGYTIGSTG